jgi:hypothetical protein
MHAGANQGVAAARDQVDARLHEHHCWGSVAHRAVCHRNGELAALECRPDPHPDLLRGAFGCTAAHLGRPPSSRMSSQNPQSGSRVLEIDNDRFADHLKPRLEHREVALLGPLLPVYRPRL